MPTYLLGFHLNPLTNPWIEKLTQTHTLIEQKPTGFRVAGTHCHLLLALVLLGCSGWLLGQEGKVPGCSDADIDFLPTDCSGGTVAAEEM
jgi:hypothetical protein